MRTIDADAMIDSITRYANEPVKSNDRRWNTRCTAIIEDMIGTVKMQPAIDAVPVVRCKDCKWWDCKTWDEKGEPLYGYCNACKHGHYSPNWEISINRKYKADWFCADGERRECDD